MSQSDIKLCKNENCSLVKNDISTEKCMLCDGYFADNGVNDIYFLEENKHDFISILQQLYQKNERQKIIICIERLSYFYRQITSIFEKNQNLFYIIIIYGIF